jgi:hypothetical protein
MTRIAAGDWSPDSLQALANYAQLVGLIGLFIAVWALWQSAKQIRHATTAARAQFLLALDDALNQHRNIRDKIDDKQWQGPVNQQERNQVRRYLAVFQRMGFLVQDGLLELDEVDALHGDRLARVLRREKVQAVIGALPPDAVIRNYGDPATWPELIWLWHKLYERRKDKEPKKRLPKPPKMPDRSGQDIDEEMEPEPAPRQA